MPETNLVADYVRASLLSAEHRARLLVQDREVPFERRDVFAILSSKIDEFAAGDPWARFIIMPGLRGTGKSTILAQVYLHLRARGIPVERMLFLGLDEARLQTGGGLNEVLVAYQNILGRAFYDIKQDAPVFILLDEVHHDPNWGLALKVLYDTSKWVFVVATGSSALELKMNTDLARRVSTEQVEPITLSESLILNGMKDAAKNRKAIADAILRSRNAKEAFDRLHGMKESLLEIQAGIRAMGLERYLRVGTLALSLRENDEPAIFQRTFDIERKVVNSDLLAVRGFDSETLVKASNLITRIAFSDRMNYESMMTAIGTNKHTLGSILSSLELTDLVYPLRAYGSIGARFRKTPKYKLAAPIFRAAHMWGLGKPLDTGEALGLLFEDAASMYLRKMTRMVPIIDVCFDSHEGGADFIITPGAERPIAMEVSYGRKGTDQLVASAERYQTRYGVLVSNSGLELVERENIVKVPREWFLLSA